MALGLRNYFVVHTKVNLAKFVDEEFQTWSRFTCGSKCVHSANCNFWGFKGGYCQQGKADLMSNPGDGIITSATIGTFYVEATGKCKAYK